MSAQDLQAAPVYVLWLSDGAAPSEATVPHGFRVVHGPSALAAREIATRAPDLVVLGEGASERARTLAAELVALRPASPIALAVIEAAPSAQVQGRSGIVARMSASSAPEERARELESIVSRLHVSTTHRAVAANADALEGFVARTMGAGRAGVLLCGSPPGAVAFTPDGTCAPAVGSLAARAADKGQLALRFYERAPGKLHVLGPAPAGEVADGDRGLDGLVALIVDGGERAWERVARALEDAGARTQIVKAQKEAVEQARSSDPSLIVVPTTLLPTPVGRLVCEDPRLASASLLVIEPARAAELEPDALRRAARRLCATELELRTRARGEPLIERIETLGAARWLKTLTQHAHMRMRMRSLAGSGELLLVDGKIKDATFTPRDPAAAPSRGAAAVRAAIAMSHGTLLAAAIDAELHERPPLPRGDKSLRATAELAPLPRDERIARASAATAQLPRAGKSLRATAELASPARAGKSLRETAEHTPLPRDESARDESAVPARAPLSRAEKTAPASAPMPRVAVPSPGAAARMDRRPPAPSTSATKRPSVIVPRPAPAAPTSLDTGEDAEEPTAVATLDEMREHLTKAAQPASDAKPRARVKDATTSDAELDELLRLAELDTARADADVLGENLAPRGASADDGGLTGAGPDAGDEPFVSVTDAGDDDEPFVSVTDVGDDDEPFAAVTAQAPLVTPVRAGPPPARAATSDRPVAPAFALPGREPVDPGPAPARATPSVEAVDPVPKVVRPERAPAPSAPAAPKRRSTAHWWLAAAAAIVALYVAVDRLVLSPAATDGPSPPIAATPRDDGTPADDGTRDTTTDTTATDSLATDTAAADTAATDTAATDTAATDTAATDTAATDTAATDTPTTDTAATGTVPDTSATDTAATDTATDTAPTDTASAGTPTPTTDAPATDTAQSGSAADELPPGTSANRIVAMADEAMRAREYRRAFDLAQRALTVDARHARAAYVSGVCLLRLDRDDEALEWAERAASWDREEPLYPLLVGDIHQQNGRRARARAAWRVCLEVEPDYAPCVRRVGPTEAPEEAP